ncbi:Uma2 family endonuclease [Sphingomonas sp.]|jgi:Uma2 family endonuclease|uniref:Uma2 family endonuclease n=1 Tax=Sphingomonas sp. TaxID=28214 RepID=UPI002ED9A7AB
MNVMASITSIADDEPQAFKLRFEHYELLDRAGTFQDRRVELIEGTLVEMSPQQRPHSYAKNELTFRLRLALDALGSSLSAQSEVTLPLGPHSGAEPDIALTDAPRGQGYIPVDSVKLVVEVADTSLRFDVGKKQTAYADAGLPEYWVVDVNGRQVHQFWAASDGVYTHSRIVPLDGELRSATMPELAIDGSGIL